MRKSNHFQQLSKRPYVLQRLSIDLLGPFRLSISGVPQGNVGTKMALLLSMLALQQGHSLSRDFLLEALWPDKPTIKSGPLLRNLLFRLRKLLKSALNGSAPVICEGSHYRLNIEAGISIDTFDFDNLIKKAVQSRFDHDKQLVISFYEEAVALYRGDLLNTSCFDIEIERERLRNLYLQAVSYLAEHSLQLNDIVKTMRYAYCMLASNPFNENAHRLIMRGHMNNGHRAEALRQFQVCQRLLQQEFNIPPEAETMALFREIQRVQISESTKHATPTLQVRFPDDQNHSGMSLSGGGKHLERPFFGSVAPV